MVVSLLILITSRLDEEQFFSPWLVVGLVRRIEGDEWLEALIKVVMTIVRLLVLVVEVLAVQGLGVEVVDAAEIVDPMVVTVLIIPVSVVAEAKLVSQSSHLDASR